MSKRRIDPSDFRLTYGITAPKKKTAEERRAKTAALQSARIASLPIDALVVYDLQDESSRTSAKRPFPYLEVIDPLEYAYGDLKGVEHPKIVYRSISDMDEPELTAWFDQLRTHNGAAVLVGAASQRQNVSLGLGDAYRLRNRIAADVPLGGVMIAERHESSGGEDARARRKLAHGCSFFVSQAVYSVTATKNLLSDLHYRQAETGETTPRILVTLSPCGSRKTLEFLDWLGVSVPRWLRNELEHAHDILERSVDLSVATFEELHCFALEKGIPLGCNVESVSLRKEEIDASVELVERIAAILRRDSAAAEVPPRRSS